MTISSIGYAVIESTDPDKWLAFGTEVLGMMETPGIGDDKTRYLRCDERPFRFAIVPGTNERLRCCGFEVSDAQSFDELCQKLQAEGIDVRPGSAETAAQRRVTRLVTLQDPSGNEVELYTGAELDYRKFLSPQGVPAFETGVNGNMGFGHAVLPAPRLSATYEFYTRILGFGDTDYMHFKTSDDPADAGMGLHFLHVDNPRHHSLALFEAANPTGCIHLMLEVKTVDEVGYCLDRVLQRKIPVTSTLGRHTNDRMLSFYMMTPGGFPLEFGCEGWQVDWTSYTPTRSTAPSLWGHKWGG
jgi:3,4-dihydroxy-9,10-secoandrosta-1,3,5(10)-triene-9,17-dione 4,5-dioxygenase